LTKGVNGLTLYVIEFSLLICRSIEHEMSLQVQNCMDLTSIHVSELVES